MSCIGNWGHKKGHRLSFCCRCNKKTMTLRSNHTRMHTHMHTISFSLSEMVTGTFPLHYVMGRLRFQCLCRLKLHVLRFVEPAYTVLWILPRILWSLFTFSFVLFVWGDFRYHIRRLYSKNHLLLYWVWLSVVYSLGGGQGWAKTPLFACITLCCPLTHSLRAKSD